MGRQNNALDDLSKKLNLDKYTRRQLVQMAIMLLREVQRREKEHINHGFDVQKM